MTPEEKRAKAAEAKARKEAEFQAAITGPRAGWNPNPKPQAAPVALSPTMGLETGDIERKPLAWFRPDPENAEFEALKEKQPGYWQNLRRDIEAAGILTPLLAMPDGLLLQGHSRLKVAQDIGLARVPVQIVLTPLSTEEIRRRRRLDNLTRFEVDEDTRLAMLAEVWPDFYLAEKKAGRPAAGNGATVAPLTAAAVADMTGKSKRQVMNDRATVQKAAEIAKEAGKATPTPADIKAARELENAKRREEAKRKPESGPVQTAQPSPPQGPKVIPSTRPPIDGEEPSPEWLAMKAWAAKLETLLNEMVEAEAIQPGQRAEIFRIVRGY